MAPSRCLVQGGALSLSIYLSISCSLFQAGKSACKAARTCNSTQYETLPLTFTSDRVCASCRLASNCTVGQYLGGTCSGAGTPGTNTVCQACDGSSGYQNEVLTCYKERLTPIGGSCNLQSCHKLHCLAI